MSDPPGGRAGRGVLAVFEQEVNVGTPLTTNEVADALGCARRTAYNKLDALVERDLLRTKKVGARGRVWWLPAPTGNSSDHKNRFSGDFSLPVHELFHRICDASPIGIAVVDSSHSIVFANDRLAEILGRSPEEITSRAHGDPDWNIFEEHGDPITEDDHPVTRVFRTGEPVWGLRHGITLPDGTERWLSSNSAPIQADDGTIEGVVVGVEDISELRYQKTRLESQRAELMRLHRVNRVIRGVAKTMIEERTREDIENAICDLIARSEPYLFAVLGQFSSSYTEFTPHATGGIGEDYLDELLNNPDAPPLDQGPGAMAAKTGHVQVVQNITELPYEHWEKAAEKNRFHSYASVPLVYEETVFGVLGVYAQQPIVFDDDEQELLQELGEMIGYALYTIEATEKLRNEQLVELTFRSEALARPFVERGGEALQMDGNGTVELEDGTFLQYYTVNGIATQDAVEVFSELATEDVRLLSTTEESFELEVHTTAESLVSQLPTFDGEITSAEIEDGVLYFDLQLPRTADRESMTARVQALYPDLELDGERLVFTPRTFRHLLESQLTDRQLTAMKVAYLAGYFEQPRQSTGEDLAEKMGVTTTTFHRHLRNAEERIAQELFDTSWSGRLDSE
ncbi:helix-turn-helix domain-containing protein [Halosolutus halophilus]|uniref:helix-turn-helix domain-containing protein n=1 Tax=Halosolutus halophilus TaxID=1552990 RepID=UPI0022351452|nr:helix-turn-helix domain-containing protein [Halosolutus halophilus]